MKLLCWDFYKIWQQQQTEMTTYLRRKKSKPGERNIWPENAMTDATRCVPIIWKSHYLEILKEYCVSNFIFYGYVKSLDKYLNILRIKRKFILQKKSGINKFSAVNKRKDYEI